MDLKAFLESFLDRALHATIAPAATTVPEFGTKAVVAVKDGYALKMLDQQRPVVPSRDYTFLDVNSFCDFLVRSRNFEPTETEILGASGVVVAVSGPVWERHTATLTLAASDAWKFWVNAVLHRYDIKNLRKLFRSRRGDIPGVNNVLADLQEVAISVAKGEKIAIDPKTGLVTSSRSEKNVQVDGKVPDHVKLAIPLHADAEPSEFVLDITPEMSDGDKLTFSLSLVDPDLVMRAAWNHQIELIRTGLGAEWLVGIGKIAFKS